MEHWYTSKEIRSILKISNQYLYQLKTRNKIEFKQIGISFDKFKGCLFGSRRCIRLS